MKKLSRWIISSNASIFQKINPQTIKKVFYPTNESEIKEAIAFARERNLAITVKGGGSSLSGASTGGLQEKVVISTQKLKTIYEINFDDGYAITDPGVTPDELNAAVQSQKSHWKFFVAPSSRDIATMGGMLSTDGGGNDSWMAGTMVDNVRDVELIDYYGNKITIKRVQSSKKEGEAFKVSSDNKELQQKLREKQFTLNDLAASHGVLGFISKLTVTINPQNKQKSRKYALVSFERLNTLGAALVDLITQAIPLEYSECFIESHHPEITEKTSPPSMLIRYSPQQAVPLEKILASRGDFQPLSEKGFQELENIRKNISKRNPPEDLQIGLFEGYGIAVDNLLHFEQVIKNINQTLQVNDFDPFLKYGHAPSLWHENNKTKKGIIMHSREIRPEEVDDKSLFKAIIALVNTCRSLGVTPKPEHKWPYSKTTEKHQRLIELREILGEKFNPFIIDCSLEELTKLVL
ncbi:MAG: FAD-binding protein [Asgard group archaeon]|nr:FAD-binding protein [Asgard group archaeon]